MTRSERLERFSNHYDEDTDQKDEDFRNRIFLLLNDDRLDEWCMVDAYYYDFSALPEHLKGKFYRDMYLLYGITKECEIITKWVERYDLDSSDPIVDGEVIHSKRNFSSECPDIKINFNKNLLSTPIPDIVYLSKTQK